MCAAQCCYQHPGLHITTVYIHTHTCTRRANCKLDITTPLQLRAMPLAKILEFQLTNSDLLGGISIDGMVLSQLPMEYWSQGLLNFDSLIIGVDTADGLAAYPWEFSQLVKPDSTIGTGNVPTFSVSIRERWCGCSGVSSSVGNAERRSATCGLLPQLIGIHLWIYSRLWVSRWRGEFEWLHMQPADIREIFTVHSCQLRKPD